MYDHLARLLLAAILAVLLKGAVALFGHSIAWWVAGLIAFAFVYGGVLVLGAEGEWWE